MRTRTATRGDAATKNSSQAHSSAATLDTPAHAVEDAAWSPVHSVHEALGNHAVGRLWESQGTPGLAHVLQSRLREGGQPLHGEIRTQLERKFGRDLGG